MTQPLWQHKDEIARRLSAAGHRLLCFDYDGSLTPIVADPVRAHLSWGVRETLRWLSSRPKVHVGIVSGRSLDDVRGRVALPRVIFAGNHGLEIAGYDLSFVEPIALGLRAEIQALAVLVEEHLHAIPGARLENKGLTLSIHFRHVRPEHHEKVREIVQQDAIRHEGRLVVASGSMIWEVRPAGDWHKGAAVNWIKSQLKIGDGAAVYVGDDRTDEDAFQALPTEISVKVGTDPTTAANYFLDGVDEVPRFLEWIKKVLDDKPLQPSANI